MAEPIIMPPWHLIYWSDGENIKNIMARTELGTAEQYRRIQNVLRDCQLTEDDHA